MGQVSFSTKIILDVHDFLNEKGMSVERLSQMAGINPTSVSNYLKGKYPGNIRSIESKLLAVLEREQAKKELLRRESKFVETSISKRIFEGCRLCHLQSDIGVIFGESGCGKTESVREYAFTHADSILIEATLGFTPSFLFEKLNDVLGLSQSGPLCNLFERATLKLKDSGRLIIIDEAEHLPYKALELIRRVHDFTACGIVLIGMPTLLSNLRGKRGTFTQLFSRVGFAIKLPSISEEDAEALVRCWLPSALELWPEFWKKSNSNARRLSKLCRMAQHISEINRREIDRLVIEKSSEVLI